MRYRCGSIIWGITLLAALAALVVGCQSDPTANKPPTDMLRIAMTGEPETFDPRQARDLVSSTLMRALFEGLTRAGDQGHAVAAQAAKIEISDDLTTYTFTLRNNHWSNGDAVTAYDFEYSWKRVLDPAFPAPNAFQLYVLKNGKAAKEGTSPLDSVGVKAVDDKTLVVTLEQPMSTFLEMISTHPFFPVNKRWEESHPHWAKHQRGQFVSNGPFMLVPSQYPDEVSMQKNEHYWDAGAVALKHLHFVSQEENTALLLYQQRKVDWAGSPLSMIPADAIPALKSQGQLHITAAAGTQFLRFNVEKEPFCHPKMRKALSYAIDRQGIVDHVLQAGQQPATALVPPSMGLEGHHFQDHDITTAQWLLAEALEAAGVAVEELPAITLTYSNSERYRKMAQALQQQWQQALGIVVQLRSVESRVAYDTLRRGDYQMTLGSWFADINDPINFLEVFSDKDNGTNNTGWEDSEYSALLQQSHSEGNVAQRRQLLQQAERRLMEAMPIAPINFFTFSYLYNADVKDVHLSELGFLDLKKASKVGRGS